MRKAVYELSDEKNKELLNIINEHTRLSVEAFKIPYSDPDRISKLQAIKERVEELRVQRTALIIE